MRIEKINDKQIRCTLTRDDLEVRHMQLSELAYGSEKARSLFRDMMMQAFTDFGFEADNTPLMIEAIPLPNESLVLVITKVDDPDELDTRFSKFSPGGEGFISQPTKKPVAEGADNILDMFHKLLEHTAQAAEAAEKKQPEVKEETPNLDLTRAYYFDNLDALIHASHAIGSIYEGENSLYKEPDGNGYILFVHKSELTPEIFNKVANILCEYGSYEKCAPSTEAYLSEHGALLMAGNALENLLQLS